MTNFVVTMKIKKNILSVMFASLMLTAAQPMFAVEPEDMPLSITEQTSKTPVITVKSGQIEVSVAGEQAEAVTVYALTGQIVKSLKAEPGVTTIDLSAGYYIVKAGQSIKRIIIR